MIALGKSSSPVFSGKRARHGINHLVVSTQLVEAGIVISYRRVYRDFAPLDSIVQAAGRCNRSFEWGIDGGTVVIWSLESVDNGVGIPSENVYKGDRSDLSISTDTLRRSRMALIPILSRSTLRETDLHDTRAQILYREILSS